MRRQEWCDPRVSNGLENPMQFRLEFILDDLIVLIEDHFLQTDSIVKISTVNIQPIDPNVKIWIQILEIGLENLVQFLSILMNPTIP